MQANSCGNELVAPQTAQSALSGQAGQNVAGLLVCPQEDEPAHAHCVNPWEEASKEPEIERVGGSGVILKE